MNNGQQRFLAQTTSDFPDTIQYVNKRHEECRSFRDAVYYNVTISKINKMIDP